MVRVDLQRRRVRAWVLDVRDEPTLDAATALKPIAKVTGWGPSADVVGLARWAGWRWAGPASVFLGTASPPTAVRRLPPAVPSSAVSSTSGDGLADDALDRERAVVALP